MILLLRVYIYFTIGSMVQVPVHIVDVFAKEAFQGNPLAVVFDADQLTDQQMLNITREMNYSESSFLIGKCDESTYEIRIFTPREEIPFAGHPTLGTASVLQRELIKHPVSRIFLKMKAGIIPVDIQYDGDQPIRLWMTQNPPEFGEELSRESVADILQVAPADIDERFPIQQVSTGLPVNIVPMKSLRATQKIKVNTDKLYPFVEPLTAKAFLCFCTDTVQEPADLHVRMLCDYYGMPEDPATGSANGCLAGYLIKHRVLSRDSIDLIVEQGLEIDRPSELFIKARQLSDRIEVEVGGNVEPIAFGTLNVR